MVDLKKQMKRSIEVKHYTLYFWICFSITMIYTMVFIVAAISINDLRLLLLSLLMVIPMSPLIIYFSYKRWLPIIKANKYQYQEVMLDELYTRYNQIGFIVAINDGVQTVKLHTKTIFNAHFLSVKNIENYMNKKSTDCV